ncbi:MAG: Ig domain-containing protein [Oscillospiraceae bacterium]|nr:Ig domain-containing protein [Oscillospiraceae bacterium]
MTVDMQQVENDVAKEDENLDAVLAENFTAVKTPSLMTVNPGMTIEESLPGPTLSVPEQVKSSAPAVTFSPTGDSSGILSTTDSNVKFQVGIKKDGSYAGPRMWMDLDGNMGIDNLTENSVIQVKRVVEGEKESDIVQFALERQPQLTATSSPATSESNNDGKIILPAGTGPVEIRVSDGDGVYKDAIVNSSNEITGLTGGKTYQLRIKADGVKLASLPIDVTVGTYSAPTKLEKPAAAFTATGEQSGILKNVDSSMVYRVGSGSWTAITGETATISSGVSGQIYVKRVGSSSANTLDSDEQVIQIQQYSAPEKEKLPVSGGTITVQYVPQAQYKAHSAPESSYVDVTNRVIQNLSQGDYDIRIKYDGAILASKPVTVTIANVPVTGISMDPKEVKLSSTDSSAKLTVTFSPLNASNQTVSWYSSNENVVRIQNSYKVSDGVAGASVVAVGQGTATIYAISNGKQATCTVTVQTNYYFTYHKNGTWYYDVGGNYTVQATGPANRLAAVKLNGQTINPYYYTVATASDGSTIVTISETAMRAMEHRAYQTLQFVYSDGGTATCYLHILSVRDKPITGDDSNIGLWVCVMLMSSAMGGALLSRRKEWE